MSYAIIRNAKYKSENLKGIYRHNERRNTNYSNKNIDKIACSEFWKAKDSYRQLQDVFYKYIL